MKIKDPNSNQLIEEMLNASPSCLKIIDKEGKLLKMNRRGLDLIEAENFQQVDHADVYDIVHEEDRENFIKFNEKVCRGEKGSLIFRIVGLKGTLRWMESYAAPFKTDCGRTAHIAITNDITERVHYEEEIKKQEIILKEASKLAALGEMAGGIAHEINNPLMIIRGKAQRITNQIHQGHLDKESILNDLQKVQETVDRISNIIKGLLIISRRDEEENFQKQNLLELVNSTLSICHEKFKSIGIELTVDIDKDIQISCNPTQISQVIVNLLNNSYDALTGIKEPKISITAKVENQKIIISFLDNGEGIPEDVRPRLMDPFFTTKGVGKGTGIGLSISRGIIKSHGGEFYLNDGCENTEFIISLPNA